MQKSIIRRTTLVIVMLFVLLGSVAGCFLLPNRAPSASFVVVYNVDADVLVVDLDASSSDDPDGDPITSYLWTFGDDVDIITPLDYSKSVTVPVLQVRYPAEGEYTIQLLVIDERGATSAPVTQTIMLPNLPVAPTP